ncbi:MAG: cell division protein FtsA [Clostridia bacterium]|nr:cell division protein FtsA [Clostridia bacterium]
MNEQELLFSMDIGTRSVVGIVGRHDGEKLNILAYDIEEHKERAMFDGQVHDIELVAKAAGKVKQRLETKLGIRLTNVAIAAAGRSLKTHKVFLERKVEKLIEVERETISSLEIEAIQKAQMEIEEMQHEDGNQYYCAGYAVVNYYLNGSIIGNLEGHKASSIGVEVLATFLPKIVVDSLYSVVSRIDLEVSSLTLEPIAAMNVSIQSNLRMLNIALVDIGAGTSDIALTKNGSVFAFAMVPIAGDEITEKLAETYLLDFDTAEKVKIALSKKSKIKFKDIMGNLIQLTSDEMIAALNPAIEQLAGNICDKILEYNGKSPSAVFLVGGGSLVPGLESYISTKLQIPLERVGLRKTTLIKEVDIKDKKLSGPEFITPIGISVTAYMNKQKDFLNVYVNDKSVKLFNSKALTVADALILVGFNPRKLIGRRGIPLTFTVNGKLETIKGEHGEPAKIFVNGAQGSLDRVLANGDRIVIDPAVDGNNAEAYVKSYAGLLKGKIVYLNKLEKALKPTITVNGEPQSPDYKIKEHDTIVFKAIDTVAELLELMQIDKEDILVDINGKSVDGNSPIYNGDYISWRYNKKAEDKSIGKDFSHRIGVTLNGEPLMIEQNKDRIMFLDIFNHIEVDVSKVKGISTMKLNGENANYTDLIKNGDIIEVHWEK